MKPLMPITFCPKLAPKAFLARAFQFFMLVALCCSGALLAGDRSQTSGVISRQELFLEHPNFEENFDRYEVLEDTVKVPADVNVLIFFGTWCHDSQREVPRMLKILETVGLPADNIEMVTLDYSKADPGGLAVAHAVEFTPTFIFYRQQKEIGRIVEKPATSLEEAIGELLVQR